MVAGVASADGHLQEILSAGRERNQKAEASLGQLMEMGTSLKKKYESESWDFGAIGFGFGGLVQRTTQEAFLCLHEEGWNRINVEKVLRLNFGLPAYIENDCKVAALAEACLGAGRGSRTVFYVTIGTGIGAGIVCDGHIVEFGDIGEAEIGHLVVLPDGPKCSCGARGCLEAVCSGPGMSALAEYMGGRAMSSHELLAAWPTGDRFAVSVVEKAGSLVGFALATAMTLVNPDLFVVGGGIGSGLPAYVELLQRAGRQWVVPYFRDRFRLVPAELGQQVVPQGAALLALQKLKRRIE